MTVSVRNLLSDGTLKRFDGLKIRYESLRVKPGFNVRIEDDDFSASIDALAEHIYAGGDYPPLLVRFDSEGTPWIVDGHRRHAAIGQCISRGAPIEWVEIKKFDGNDVDALAATVTTAEGRALTPLEMAGALKRLAAFGLTATEIARKVGKTPARVEQLLLLASANHDVHQAIKAGDVSASLASEIVRKHGEKAGEVIAAEKDKAKAVGKRKVTAGTIGRSVTSNPPSPAGKLRAQALCRPSLPYDLDTDPAGVRALAADAIRGAIGFGAQGVNPPPEGHWLTEFWEAGMYARNGDKES